MHTSKISVIVPIYKVEMYLNKCINSIVNQTYKNLEIILVDDGSPDTCPQICDDWAKKDDRIKVLHTKNSGVASARNSGLKVATGDYIGFVDSDDWIDEDMYEFLLNYFTDDTDFVRCSYRKINNGTTEDFFNNGKVEVLNSNQYLIKLFSDNTLNSNCWCKLYKRPLIGNAEFPENIKIGEDHYFNYIITKKAKKIITVNKSKYNYVLRNSSATNNENINSWLQNVYQHKIIFETEKNNEETSGYAADCFASWSLDLIALCVKYNKLKSKEYKENQRILKESFSNLLKVNLNKKLVFKLLLNRYAPKVYQFVLKIFFKINS